MKKIFCTDLNSQGKTALVPARQAQRSNQERISFVCPLWVPIHLRFNSQQGPPLSGRTVYRWKQLDSDWLLGREEEGGGGSWLQCSPLPTHKPLIILHTNLFIPVPPLLLLLPFPVFPFSKQFTYFIRFFFSSHSSLWKYYCQSWCKIMENKPFKSSLNIFPCRAGIFKESIMGARYRGGRGLSYRPARLYIGWRNSFLGIDSGAPHTFKNTGSEDWGIGTRTGGGPKSPPPPTSTYIFSWTFHLKGHLSQDYLLQVFSWIIFPQAPENNIRVGKRWDNWRRKILRPPMIRALRNRDIQVLRNCAF